MNSADAWHESNAPAWPDDPNGSMLPILEASIEAAKARHPSAQSPPVAPPDAIVLTAADRCDAACSAAALYRTAKGNRYLDFCRHHLFRYFPKMSNEQGWKVVGSNPELFAELEGQRAGLEPQ